MTSTLHFTHEYELVSCGADGCDQWFAMSVGYYRETKRTGQTWYCPRGHPRVWRGQTTEAKLQEVEAQLVHANDQLKASAEETEKMRLRLLRDRQRFANGVCPCCNRSFTNVMRHMKTQHPDYDPTHVGGQIEFKCSCGRSFATLHGLRTHQGRMRPDNWMTTTSRWRAHLTVV